MYGTDAMDHGVFMLDYPAEGFPWVYPERCGFAVGRDRVLLQAGGGLLLLYVLSGEGRADTGGEPLDYGPDWVLVRRDGALELRPERETEYLYLLLRNAGEAGERAACFRARPECGLDRMFGHVCHEAWAGRPESVYEASAAAFALLMKLLEQRERERAALSPLVREAIAAIREDYAFLAGMDGLADRLGVTKSHLIRTFTAETGGSPGKFLQAVKLDNAKLMLQNRDYSIETVAAMAGYSGANYFCKVFRRATGETPGQYRAAHGGPAADLEARERLRTMEDVWNV